MTDVITLVSIGGLFAVGYAIVRLCERITAPSEERDR